MGAFRNPREKSIDDPYRRSFAQTEQIAAQVPDCSPGHSR
jgi:hypothetical protein